jgi:hypothetical protein
MGRATGVDQGAQYDWLESFTNLEILILIIF